MFDQQSAPSPDSRPDTNWPRRNIEHSTDRPVVLFPDQNIIVQVPAFARWSHATTEASERCFTNRIRREPDIGPGPTRIEHETRPINGDGKVTVPDLSWSLRRRQGITGNLHTAPVVRWLTHLDVGLDGIPRVVGLTLKRIHPRGHPFELAKGAVHARGRRWLGRSRTASGECHDREPSGCHASGHQEAASTLGRTCDRVE